MRSHSLGWLLLLSGVLLYGVWRLFELRFAAGDIYPPYSSLRADRQGSRALLESIAGVPGFSVDRNFRPFEKIRAAGRTVFYLGVSPSGFEYGADFEQFEKLAAAGARIVIGFRPAPTEIPKAGGKPIPPTPLEERWHLRFTYLRHIDVSDPNATSLMFTHAEAAWHGNPSLVERSFGAGSVALVAQSYPLSNAGLQKDRQPGLIVALLGKNRRVTFDETHLGVAESGSVAGLARKYHLEGLAFALLTLTGLFIWKSSVSFLPSRHTNSEEQAVTSTKDSASGLANLLRRNIPAADLVRVCAAQWEHDQAGARYPAAKVATVRDLAARGGNPASLYSEIHRVLTADRSQP